MDGYEIPSRVEELRRQALLCRRAARIPTSGAALLDKILVALAEQLDRDAASKAGLVGEVLSLVRNRPR